MRSGSITYILTGFGDFGNVNVQQALCLSSYVLTILDVENLEKNEFPISGESAADTRISTSPLWSSDDLWIAFTTMTMSVAPDKFETILVNLESRLIKNLEGYEFVSWSEAETKQYLFLNHNFKGENEETTNGNVIVSISEVDQENVVQSIYDMGKYAPSRGFNIAWHSNENKAIAVSFGSNTTTSFSEVDFNFQSWGLLPYKSQGIITPSLWSPDGHWLSLISARRLFLWNVLSNDPPTENELPGNGQPISVKGWTKDSLYLVYQNERKLFAVDPNDIKSPSLIFDLSSFLVKDDPLAATYLWIPR